MSYIEAPEKTVLRFSEMWAEQMASGRLISNLVSLNKETNREADTYHFLVENDRLVDPETGKAVMDFITPGVERDVAGQLQKWAGTNDEGLAFWISPPLADVYPCAKTILHRIAYTMEGKKVVLNSTILFDAEFDNPEALRQTLFTQTDTEENITKILDWIGEKSAKNIHAVKNEAEVRQKAAYFAEMFQRGIPRQYVIDEMRRTGFLGQNSISCAGSGTSTFSNLLDSKSLINIYSNVEGWHSGTCRVCGAAGWVGPCSICKPCESKL
jgi:hypothetical protein